MTTVAIMLLTYAGAHEERTAYATRTLRTTLDNIETSHETILHIADDGSPQAHIDALCEVAELYRGTKLQGLSITKPAASELHSYGANYNRGTQAIHTRADYVLPLEDDWELLRPLNLDPLIRALDSGAFGCVRLGYIGLTRPLRGEFIIVADDVWFRFDPESPEPHVFAGGPRLETVAWERGLGPWPETLPDGAPAAAGDIEFMVAHRPASRRGVAWNFNLVRPCGDLFAHIGTVKA